LQLLKTKFTGTFRQNESNESVAECNLCKASRGICQRVFTIVGTSARYSSPGWSL